MRHHSPTPFALGLALLLTACGEAEEPGNELASVDAAGAQPDQASPIPEPTEAVTNDTGARSGGGQEAGTSLPPAGAGLRFVGLWAAEPSFCADKAWRFTANSLHTPAGSVCQFSRVTPAAGGYDIEATCTAEGPPTGDELEIRFAESAQAMMFESDLIADAGLIYCGPE